MNLSKLIVKARNIVPQLGKLQGYCIFCGEYSNHGYSAKLKTNFTAYPYLQQGEIICPNCFELYNNSEYRKNMFLVSKSEFRTFKREEGKAILLNLPIPPFALYFTRTWKKQGWITLMQKVSFSKTNFFVGLDYEVILVNSLRAKENFQLIENLLEKKISKTELKTGQLKVKSFERLDMDLELLNRLQLFSGDPLWGLCVFLN